MTQKEIADYYSKLSNGEKGRFTAFLSMNLGGSPHLATKDLGMGS